MYCTYCCKSTAPGIFTFQTTVTAPCKLASVQNWSLPKIGQGCQDDPVTGLECSGLALVCNMGNSSAVQ